MLLKGAVIQHYSTIPIPWEAAVASWLVRSTRDRAVRTLVVVAGDIVLCSWVIHFTPRVRLFSQVYKWVPAK